MMKKKAFMSWLMVSKRESASTKAATRKSNFPAEWLDWYSNGHEMGPTWLFLCKKF